MFWFVHVCLYNSEVFFNNIIYAKMADAELISEITVILPCIEKLNCVIDVYVFCMFRIIAHSESDIGPTDGIS